MSYNTCQVNGCRFSEEHTTERHCCGNCKFNGHGLMECEKEYLIKELEKFKGDFIFNWCEIEGCIDQSTHTTKGHSCLYCDARLDNIHLPYCPNNVNTINSNSNSNSICDNLSVFNNILIDYIKDVKIKIKPNQYTKTDGGMGCTWFIRNNNGKKEYLFMHSDSWGQYGTNTSHLPRFKAFIYGYTFVDKNIVE